MNSLKGVVVALLGLSTSAFAQPVFDVSGTCPGVVNLAVTNATANKKVYFYTGTAGGSSAIVGGPCAGTNLDLTATTLRFNGKSDATGSKTLTPNLAAGACAVSGQWVDATTCAVSEAKSLTPACTQVDVSWVDTGPPAVAFMPDPVLAGLWTESSVANGLREDFEIEDPAGNIGVPATLGIDFYDASFNIVCSALFDISTSTVDPLYTAESIDPATGLPSGNVLAPLDPAFLTILGGGFTDCDPIDPAGALGVSLGGTNDLRALALGDWGFAYNVISPDMASDLSSIVGAAAYASDYDPFIIGESFFGLEYNFAATYDRTCEVTHVDPATGFLDLLNKPLGPLGEHGIGFSYWVIGL